LVQHKRPGEESKPFFIFCAFHIGVRIGCHSLSFPA
jgi:hypothetical protein